MKTKLFELRDRGTFIPLLVTQLVPDGDQEHYLLRRAGFTSDETVPYLSFVHLQANKAAIDPYDLGSPRTFVPAYDYIRTHWDSLNPGDVVDVEYLLGETAEPKKSERFG